LEGFVQFDAYIDVHGLKIQGGSSIFPKIARGSSILAFVAFLLTGFSKIFLGGLFQPRPLLPVFMYVR